MCEPVTYGMRPKSPAVKDRHSESDQLHHKLSEPEQPSNLCRTVRPHLQMGFYQGYCEDSAKASAWAKSADGKLSMVTMNSLNVYYL